MHTGIFKGVISLCLGFVLKYFNIDKNKWSKQDKLLIIIKTTCWVHTIHYTGGSQTSV